MKMRFDGQLEENVVSEWVNYFTMLKCNYTLELPPKEVRRNRNTPVFSR